MRAGANRVAAPPAVAEVLLRGCLPKGPVGGSILGDLRQDFAELCSQHAVHRARRWYWGQVLAVGGRYLLARRRLDTRAKTRYSISRKTGSGLMGSLMQDLHYAFRSFARRPGFSLLVIALLGLGIGATTTIFSIVDGVLLKKLPYPNPRELVFFDNPAHSVPLMRDWQTRTNSYSVIAGAWDRTVDLTNDGAPVNVQAALVTEDFFRIFGVTQQRGRLFSDDDFAGPARVAVVSHRIWQTRWGSDEETIGRSITLAGQPLTVVGILPRSFKSPVADMGGEVDFFVPYNRYDETAASRNWYIMTVFARLRQEVTHEAAQAELDAVSRQLAQEHPDHYTRRDGSPRMYQVVSLHEAIVGDVKTTLYMLLGAVGLMLLIACANVANLVLARGTDREREMALRAALGAGRSRVMAQLFTESVQLSVIGGGLGVALAYVGVNAFEALNPGGIPRVDSIAVDWRVMGFALVVSAVTGVLFGVAPAFKASRVDVSEALKDATGSVTAGRGRQRLRSALVVLEIALALMLLVGAGLLFNSFVRLMNVDPGFSTDRITAVMLRPGPSFPQEQRREFTRQYLARVRSLPGVEAAAAGVTIPLGTPGGSMCCWMQVIRPATEEVAEPVEGTPLGNPESAIITPVTPGYFEVLEARLVQGRGFVDADEFEAMPPAVMNVSLARRVFGDERAVGKSFYFGDTRAVVVGVIDDMRHWGLEREDDEHLYLPFFPYASAHRIQIAVKSGVAFGSLAERLRETLWVVEPDLPIVDIIPYERQVANSIAEPRFYSALLISFATVAMLLAAGGIYGSMLYAVGRRHREMGIRLALGARGINVIGMIVRHGLMLTAIGVGLGLAGAYAASRTLESFMFGITAADPSTYVAVSALLAAVALAACYFPARKAAATDPMETLRAE
ncbi:MAG: ABC transporter permease [Gemmatimonadota bacterium]|nr:MAG: ABC transporter permease [Gemmatimonadota bacterium]